MKYALKKYIKNAAVIIAAMLMIVMLCSCSKQEPENVQYSTFLSISSSFSGVRTINIIYPTSIIEPGSQNAENLEKIISKYCPSSITYSKSEDKDRISYTFTMSFSSFSDYTSKISDILGNQPVVIFSNPNTALTTGWRIEEDFQSMQLFDWIRIKAKADGIDLPDFPSDEPETKVTFGNETVSTTPAVSVNRLTGQPIEKIKIVTVNKTTSTESLFDRTITFTVTQKTFDSLGDKLTQYFSSVTDSSAASQWLLENNLYTYTASFENISLKQLEGYTNKLFSSVYGDISYLDKTIGSTALAYQNSYTETIDFSNYVGQNNSDVPVEYTYSLTNNSDLDECRIYSDMKWTIASDLLEANNPGKIAAIRNQSPSLTLRINDGKQYVPKSIDVAVTPLDNNNIRKSVSFVYDIADEGYEASDYTASYFTPLGIVTSQTVDGGYALCTISINGSAGEINAKLADIFGDGNIISSSSEIPAMTLRTKKYIEDCIDLSSLLTGKNTDTPVNYIVNPADGESAESLIYQPNNDSDPVYAEPDENGRYQLPLTDMSGTFRCTVSAPNIFDVVIFCIISMIMILATFGIIFFLKNRRVSQPAIEEGKKKVFLPGKTHRKILPRKASRTNKGVNKK